MLCCLQLNFYSITTYFHYNNLTYKEGMEKGLHIVARNMKQMGLTIADIAKATGLSERK